MRRALGKQWWRCSSRPSRRRFPPSSRRCSRNWKAQRPTPPLSEEEVRQLVSRTEGWIAGLHLAALTLQRREDRTPFLQAFTGSQRYLLDYVQQEILARLPTNVRDFLLHTAILSRLEAS